VIKSLTYKCDNGKWKPVPFKFKENPKKTDKLINYASNELKCGIPLKHTESVKSHKDGTKNHPYYEDLAEISKDSNAEQMLFNNTGRKGGYRLIMLIDRSPL
jgi:hypothetical protein